MPPNRFSRHRFCTAETDEAARLLLSERAPYRYRDLSDNRQHIVRTGDTLWNLAGRYFAPMPRPAGLWWIIADFQPEPIHDPTIELAPGTVITIPSLRTVQEEVFNERRRRDEEA
jgi:hypothetical protein